MRVVLLAHESGAVRRPAPSAAAARAPRRRQRAHARGGGILCAGRRRPQPRRRRRHRRHGAPRRPCSACAARIAQRQCSRACASQAARLLRGSAPRLLGLWRAMDRRGWGAGDGGGRDQLRVGRRRGRQPVRPRAGRRAGRRALRRGPARRPGAPARPRPRRHRIEDGVRGRRDVARLALAGVRHAGPRPARA